MNVLIVSSSPAYSSLFSRLGHTIVEDISKAELVVFTGGEDVTPRYYDSKTHNRTHNNPYRDAREAMIFEDALSRKLPLVGICRGGQFLNVMSGGSMYQHVEKHCGNHEIIDVLTGETVLVSSTHHQMMKPSEKGLLVASSALLGGREWYEGEVFKKDTSNEDIEVVFYQHTRSLCFQPHPEFVGAEYDGMFAYFAKCLERFIYEDSEV